MTETEAKEKWCPFARVSDLMGKEAACNRYENEDAILDHPDSENFGIQTGAYCIASACMAWRWDDTFTSSTEEGTGGDMVLRLKRKPGEPRQGYCGLAGTPGMP